MEGHIARLVRDKGFGFVKSLDGRDHFFHRTDLLHLRFEDLVEGQHVSFEEVKSPKGPRAGNIVRLESV